MIKLILDEAQKGYQKRNDNFKLSNIVEFESIRQKINE